MDGREQILSLRRCYYDATARQHVMPVGQCRRWGRGRPIVKELLQRLVVLFAARPRLELAFSPVAVQDERVTRPDLVWGSLKLH